MSLRDPLDDLLDRWRIPQNAPSDLKPQIRREIAAVSSLAQPTWLARIDTVFARPSFAALFITACVLLGLFLAETRVARLHARYGGQIARSYVQLIDPLLDPQIQSANSRKEPR